MSRAEEILSMVKHIPSFPKVAHKVMGMIDNPEVKAKDLAEVIQFDQAITANVLKMCNAAYFGLSRKVTSLDDALVVIGQSILKDIIIASSSAKYYKGAVGAGYDLEQGDLWKHSVAVAITAKMLAREIPGVDSSAAFTAGLLHDIGKRVVSSFVADEFEKIMAMVRLKNCSFVEAEVKCLGISHPELGARILEKWEFDKEMVEAVRMHHELDSLKGGPLMKVVTLSNSLVISTGIGVGADGLASRVNGEEMAKLGFTEEKMDLLMAEVVMEMEKAEDILNI
ncbi:MAG: HDOD domain-containing protein [Proteobacteria bacterium]|nr:HDOD domain-containing protein [Pseudomonadota bacterium]MBU1737722.1 HDOD domain-containing protein [Pseudomonadota bacterium]